MKPFREITAIAAPLLIENVNTDDIFPGPAASPIIRAGNSGAMTVRGKMGLNAFAALRWNDDGSPRPEFVLNQPPYDRAQILLGGSNFGCGSSREHAVWCLDEIGIRCVIAPSFGDIFHNNCFKSGLLPIRLPREDVDRLAALSALPDPAALTVDLERQQITVAGTEPIAFQVDPYQRNMLLQGLDEIAMSLSRLDAIKSHYANYLKTRPWLVEGLPRT